MTRIFGALIGKSVEVYIDDIIVKTPKGGDHAADLAVVFEQLKKYNMRLNPEKCTFGVKSGKFLGYMLTNRGIELNPEKCQAIVEMKSPRTVKEVQQLAGQMAAIGRFLPKAALRALPLYALLKKGANFTWSEEAEQAFSRLKEVLTSPPILSSPKPGEPLYLYLVVRDKAVSSVLANGEAQAKDPILEQYLSHLKRLAATFRKVEFRHVPRAENDRADTLAKLASTGKPGLNRTVIQGTLALPYIAGPDRSTRIHTLSVGTDDDWRTPIVKNLTTGWLPPDKSEAMKLTRNASWYTLVNGDLFKRGFSTPLLKCLSKERAEYVLAEIHEGSCGHHPGGRSLARKVLRAGYYWPTLEKDAADHVKRCDPCQKHADHRLAPPERLSTMVSPWPFHQWGMDLLGPFTTAPGQLKHLVVAVDYFTKWIEAEPLATITSARIQRFFYKNIISRFGVPGVLITDNGTQFASQGFKELVDGLHIKHHFTSVEHPQTNGQAEAANRVILRGLKKRLDDAKGNWAEQLDHVLWAYRTTPHSTTGESPFRLTFGTEAVIPAEIGEPSARTMGHDPGQNDQLINEDLDLLAERRAVANCRELIAKQHAAIRYSKKVVHRVFLPGDLVLRNASIGARGTERGKLAANWEGPYRITEATGTGAYKLEKLSGEKIPRTWNAANLNRYYS
ncbi:uncharacterized protein LOC130719235 [Lotus japonicus]|uniref:uncharacterized protein LOC130719235 n=1 Tax=Lotus japonicus TaxID=34305 RepID=UPI00258D63A1|nr:uncharacterized protein LOC130719235 [Lotus japonicus]